MRIHRVLFVGLVLCTIWQSPVHAQQCEAHYKFDGSISDSGSGGITAYLADAKKAASSLNFVAGKDGQALVLDGNTILRIPISLNFDRCPRFTMSMWLQAPEELSKSGQSILGTGAGNSPGLRVSGRTVSANGTANGIWQPDVLYAGPEWVFVAVVYDSIDKTYRLHWRGNHKSKDMGDPTPAGDSLWLGSEVNNLRRAAAGIVIDDLRIYPNALTVENVEEIRSGTAPLPGSDAAFASSEGMEGGACTAQGQCGVGLYCAFDRSCHPDRHRPLQDIVIGVVNTTAPVTPILLPEGGDEPEPGGSSTGGTPRKFSPYPVGDPTVTDYSGRPGAIARSLDFGRNTRMLTKIEWQEGNNRPCAVTLFGYHYGLDAGEPPQGWPSVEFDCRSTGLLGSSFKDVSTSLTTPVHAIQVCNNTRNSNWRLKGVRLFGAKINSDGTTEPANLNDEEVLPNCNNWGRKRSCPANQVATGVVVLASDAGGDDKANITGMRLICREVRVP